MKPLNYKERNDQFFGFIVAGTFTLFVTIFCFYSTIYFLTNTIADNKAKQYSNFQRYKQNQQLYTKELEKINQSLTRKSLLDNTLQLVTDFKSSLVKNGEDTSLLMKKVIDLSHKNMEMIDQRKVSQSAVDSKRNEANTWVKRLNELKVH